MKKIIGIIFILSVLLFPALSYAQGGTIEHPLFMREYSAYVIGRLGQEKELRAALGKYILQNKAKFAEGIGHHPGLFPGMFMLAGAERLNCISGKYYEKFLTGLNNEERHMFYSTAEEFSWWVICIAEEEADSMNIKKMNPPLSFRQPDDTPGYIKATLISELSYYLKEKEEKPAGGKELSFTALKCDD